MSNVRQATLEDIQILIDMGKKMHDESPMYKDTDFSEQKLLQLGQDWIDAGGVFIAETKGKVIGMYVGMLTEHYFGHDLIAHDLAVYVLPEYRGGSAFIKLVKIFEEWAFKNGAVKNSMGISTEIAADKTLELYKKMGFRGNGYLTVKDRPNVF